MERKLLLYVYDKDYEIPEVINSNGEISVDRESIDCLYHKVVINDYKDIQTDIVTRSDKYYYKTYYIINKKGYARVQNRMDTFSRHYLIKNTDDLVSDMFKFVIETADPRQEIEKHMKYYHVEYCSDCDIRE